MSVPEEITYASIRPKGWYSRFKEWPVEPLSSNTFWNPNEVIRLLITLNSGVMDPYRSHIVFKVSVPSTMKVGGLQVDNSAQSFISQLVVSSNNNERERINEYDTLAAFLTDMGFSEIVCENRESEGLGYANYEIGLPRSEGYGNKTFAGVNNFNAVQTESTFRGYDPTRYNMGNYGIITSLASNTETRGQMGSSVFGYQNFMLNHPNTTTADTTSVTENGMGGRIRADYQAEYLLRDYIDSTTSYLTTFPQLNAGVLNSASIRAGTQINPGANSYQINYKQSLTAEFATGILPTTILRTANNIPNIAELWGYDRLVNAKYSTGCGEPMISNTQPLCQFGYGLTAASPISVPVRQFSIPILSTLIGVLIDPDQFCLLPLRVLYNTLLEFTLSQYAMFTTGYCDYHEFDAYGMNTQQPRSWQITEFYYNLHIYEFPDEEIQQYLVSAIAKDITITGSNWMLSAQYQISSGNTLRGNWQINVASDFLSEVVFLFLSNEYSKYSFCRKQFRLSHNIRSMQLKFNTDFYPAQPITGNAGCPIMIDTSGDNSEFLQYLLMSYNYRFVTNVPQPRINAFNFAVNGRPYSPSQVGTYLNPTFMFNNGTNLAYSGAVVNSDTALGMPHIHENRCVGRAAYVYSFEAHSHSRNYMVGVNSRNARPFEVSFDTWTQNSFPTDSTMYAFTRSSVIVIYNNNGIDVLGR